MTNTSPAAGRLPVARSRERAKTSSKIVWSAPACGGPNRWPKLSFNCAPSISQETSMPTGNSTSNRTSAASTPPGPSFQSSHTQMPLPHHFLFRPTPSVAINDFHYVASPVLFVAGQEGKPTMGIRSKAPGKFWVAWLEHPPQRLYVKLFVPVSPEAVEQPQYAGRNIEDLGDRRRNRGEQAQDKGFDPGRLLVVAVPVYLRPVHDIPKHNSSSHRNGQQQTHRDQIGGV